MITDQLSEGGAPVKRNSAESAPHVVIKVFEDRAFYFFVDRIEPMFGIQWPVGKPFPVVIMAQKYNNVTTLIKITVWEFCIEIFHTFFTSCD
jgi:hypothetical protein